MARAEFIEVQKYLAGADYPATKEQLMEHAKRQGANKDVLEALSGISDGSTTVPTRSAAPSRSIKANQG